MYNMEQSLASFSFTHSNMVEIILHPTTKCPVVFEGELFYEQTFGSELDDNYQTYVLYITKENSLVLLKLELDWTPNPITKEPSDFAKVRPLNTYKDVWTFFKACEMNIYYREFLKNVSVKLTGKESYFWLPLSSKEEDYSFL
jgi:hypothetical protein